MDWFWDEALKAFFLVDGAPLGVSAMIAIRDKTADRTLTPSDGDDPDVLGQLVVSLDITIPQWERTVWDQIETRYTAQYLLGRGGIHALTDADKAELAQILTEQRQYLRTFAQDIEAGGMTAKQVAARTDLYHAGTVGSYEAGHAAAFHIRLPARPTQGSPCRSNCRCYWDIIETETEVLATWTLGGPETGKDKACDVCIDRSRRWNPLRFSKLAIVSGATPTN